MARSALFKLSVRVVGLTLAAGLVATPLVAGAVTTATTHRSATLWSAENRTGDVQLKGQVPLIFTGHSSNVYTHLVGAVSAPAQISLNFGLPLRNITQLNALIVAEARTHREWSRAQIYAHFSPPQAQYNALRRWLLSQGYTVTHVGRDRLAITAKAPASVVERSLHVHLNVYRERSFSYDGVAIPSQDFYSNTTAPVVPARLGLQTITGLSNIDSPLLLTQVQLTNAATRSAAARSAAAGSAAAGTRAAHAVVPHTRSGGYYPKDLRSMYDITGVDNYGTGQTIGYTLWGAGEVQASTNAYATVTGEPALTVDTPCTASGNSPTTPSSCSSIQVQSNHLLNILENGNTNNNYGGNAETGLDVELSHGVAPGAAEKYYLGDCSSTPSPGLTNGDNCNGSDVGMEDAMEDAANDPTLHVVSNSWIYGGDAEYGATDPFLIASNNDYAIAAAAGTTFYYGSGDTGSYEAGYPSDSPYTVGVGGTSQLSTQALIANVSETATATNGTSTLTFSTANATTLSNDGVTGVTGAGITGTATVVSINTSTGVVTISGTISTLTASAYEFSNPTVATLSSEDLWAAEGTWCTNIFARPAWQNVPAVTANATCPGRAQPDISAIADTNTSVYECYARTATTDSCGSVGGTSVATPVTAAMEADTENFVAAQTYPGATPAVGFEGPIMYELGNSGHYADYFRAVLCGNDADPSGSPDGESAGYGWNEASGWGTIDWTHYSTGYAQELGAEGLSMPSNLNQNYQWTCDHTPGNSTEHGVSFPSTTTGYAVGTAASAPWFSTYLPSGSWGATNTFYKTTNSGTTWVASNPDMMSIACTSSTTCVEVGDGGVIDYTSNAGSTWTSVDNSKFDQALTQVQCPSSTVCFAAGDRGTILQSSDGGQTWSYSPSIDGNPIYGLSCPDANTCYATDVYAHVEVTTNGGTSWSMQTTPVTTPAINVPASGGPNPYSGLFGISCASDSTCVAVGGFPQSGNQEPIETTSNGGTTWTADTSGDTSNNLYGVSCLSGTTTCYAVGAAGTILVSTDDTTWTAMTSGTTKALTGIDCLSTTSCVATGQSGTIDVLSGSTWTPSSTTLGASAFLAGISCLSATDCFATGHQGVTVSFDSTNVAGTVAQLNGGGYTGTLDALACTSTTTCTAVGASGTIVGTTNGGQTWLPETSGSTATLDGESCAGSSCLVVGSAGTILVTTNGGATWTPQTSGLGSGVTIEEVSCVASTCVAVATGGLIIGTSNYGTTWSAQTPTLTFTPAQAATVTTSLAVTGPGITGSGVVENANASSGVVSVAGTIGSLSASPYTFGASFTATATNGTSTLTFSTANAANIFVGMSVTGAGITGSATVTNVASGVVTISGTISTLTKSAYAFAETYTASATNGLSVNTIAALDGVACAASQCLAVGAIPSGSTHPAILTSSNAGATWTTASTSALEALSSVACVDSANCFAGGANGTTIETNNGGATWVQEGNPLSGPTTALNTGTTSSILAIDGLACTSTACYAGTASSGNVMSTPLVTVTVNETEPYGTTPPVTTGISASDPSLTYSPSGAASSVTGTLTCSTTATSTSLEGTYPITSCSGLTANGSSVVYAYATSSYTVTASAPTATITSPATGATYAVGASAPTSFSCAEGAGGPGLTSCTDSNGASSPTGALVTTTPGDFTYTVTATSGDGQTATSSIAYTVAAAPTATITSPSSGNTYTVGTSVATSFSCSDSAFGPGLTSCVDSNGASSPSGALVTTTPGDFTYTVTATSSDGQTSTTSITYTVVADAPTATISSPSSGNTYAVGETVPTSFSCQDGNGGPGITTCADSNGATTGSGDLVTTTAGEFTYSVTATSGDGQTDTTSISYTVASAPTATITSPGSGNTYAVGQSVPTSFSCSDSAYGPGILSCTDDNGGSGTSGSLATGTAGHFTYSVTAVSIDGQSTTTSISYSVASAPTATISSPTSGTTYAVGQSVPTSFSCHDSSFGPGISSCKDSNGSTSGTGALATGTPGHLTYSVTATSSDGQATTTTISYTVAAAPSASISSPTSGNTYALGQSVPTSFSCHDSSFGPGISSCVDANGSTSGTGSLATGVAGSFTYTVTATSHDGQTATTSIGYTVSKGVPSVHVTATPTSPVTGSVLYTVSVSGISGHVPAGSVGVTDGTQVCTVSALSNGSGSCRLTEPAGTYTVTARYNGSSEYNAASGTLHLTVDRATPTVHLSGPTSPPAGEVTYTVSVTGVTGLTPTGSVIVSDGTRTCHVTLSAGGGHCQLNEPAGTRSITATYSGNANYLSALASYSEHVS